MIFISLKYVLISSLLIVKSPSSLEPTRTTILVSWDHDLGYWGQYWSISMLLYQLMQHILPLLVPAHQDWEKSEQIFF